MAPVLLGLGLLIAGLGNAARAEPPIQSAEDAACRLEARARVFTTPNPHGIELEILGKQIYMSCMQRTAKPRQRSRRHRRR
ncbi:hypothetical protein [Methylobacterium trifolii]|uniref:hypothetical protein n=1 Tax=Methylobacterium trifolii TaxID=1003092 RepID=UPI001EE0D23D|nr:hypothetical protein [Methylobacterium trifolii]